MAERAGTPGEGSNLAPVVRALFERRRQAAEAGRTPVIPRRPMAEPLPLSPAQERIWFFAQMAPGSSAYNRPVALRLRGRLDVAALQRALDEILRRHQALLTRFVTVEGRPIVHVAPAHTLELAQMDLRREPACRREEAALRLASEEAARPFDLGRGPLARGLLLRTDEEEWVLVLSFHHIVFDAWSETVLRREMAALYPAFAGGRPSPLPDLPIRYADYAAWQREQLQSEAMEKHLAYWRQQLAAPLPTLEMPTGRPGAGVPSCSCAVEGGAISATLTEQLKAVAGEEGATLFMAILAGFSALLHRYSGQEDIIVGTPLAGRDRFETEGLIGCFINTLALRTDLSGDPSFRELLRRVRRVALEGYAHQALPFDRLVREIRPPRDAGRHPLFQAFLNLRNVPAAGGIPGLQIEPLELESQATLFDLDLEATLRADALHLRLRYDATLYEALTARCLLADLEAMLEAAAADPDRPILTISSIHYAGPAPPSGGTRPAAVMAPSTEPVPNQESIHPDRPCRIPATTPGTQCQGRLTEERAGMGSVGASTIHERVAAQAQRTPEAVAVTCKGQHLTYGELEAQANRLACYLQSQGVGPDALVGVCMERSLEMIVGLLGILKAGGAYLPLDPAYPGERLAFMLEDAQARLLLTQHHLRDRLPSCSSRLIFLDGDGPLQGEASETPASLATPDSLAYVIYTSGSTGRPKGVMVTHRNVTRLFDSTQRWFGFGAQDVWTLFHSYAFDFSVWEIWGALLHGGRLVVVPYWVSRSPEVFHALLRSERVTVLNQTPSAFRQLIRADEAAGRAPDLSLRLVILGGEALNLQSLRPWFARHGDRQPQVVNMYGITETTVHVTYRPVVANDLERHQGSVIGGPIPDLRLYLLDENMQPVGQGMAGEICVGGAGVTRGYLNRPELTAERFVRDPFVDDPGARMYRSGDLARRLPDGDLEYLGRADDQVKVRGFRIELGEVEGALACGAGVREAVIVAREDSTGGKRLVAYVVPDSAQAPSVAELRSAMAERLPDYMVPSTFVFLESLPLTPSGKVDRRALPAPGSGPIETGTTYLAPRAPVEKMLASLWAQLLGVPRVGVLDDFFVLGGHSLLAAQFVARVREALQVEVPAAAVFENPTIAGLAAIIEKQGGDGVEATLPPIMCISRDGSLPLSLPQERVWFLDRLTPGNLAYNAQTSVRLRGALDAAILQLALSEIVRRHEILRTTFPAVEGRPVQVIHEPYPVRVPVVDLRAIPEAEREVEAERLIAEECSRTFDVTQLPLVRWTVFRLREEEHIFLHVEHHLVHDGWSLGVFLRELSALYTAFAVGEPSPLPEPAIQFADWAAWQQTWMQGDTFASQLAYWRSRLSGSPPLLALPTDRPRPKVQSFRGQKLTQELEPALYEALRVVSRREGVTLFMTLLAAFQALLHRYTGQDDIVVGSGVANRRHQETEGLIGMMVNTVVLRADLSGSPSFRELLSRVRSAVIGAHANQDLPFEKLVDALRPGRDLGYNPIFQVMFSFHDSPIPDLEFAGLRGTVHYLGNNSAKFDLNVMVVPRAEQRVGLEARAEDSEAYIQWEFSTDILDASTVERMMRHYHALLQALVADVEQPIDALPLLTEAERRRLLTEWNDTRTDYPREQSIQEVFEAQVQRTPAAVALTCGEQALTYAELNARANRVARYLRRLGIGPKTIVGLCAERSVEMVVGLLGILKAGVAYLPLDPSYPEERLALMIEDTRARLVLTQEAMWQRSSLQVAAPGLEAVCLDADWQAIAQESADNLPNLATPDSLAYVIYTSGSTGRPKGVEVVHRGVVRLVKETNHVDLRPEDVLLQFAPVTFDASTFEIWGALLNGARLAIMPPGPASLADLGEAIREHGVTVLWLTASLFNAMVDENLEGLQPLRLLLAGGEALSVPHVLKAARALPNCRLINGYGPTENTTFTCCYPVPASPELGASVPIGRPIANTQVYILDAAGQPVPIGVPGELYAGGDGLARGYLNDPELTARCFVQNPFGEAGSRLYRTGDLARYLPDGNIEFLGRLDRQIKIRGFRIEPGEIEATLLQHPAVREAAVVVREDRPGDRRLVAYMVPAREGTAGIEEIHGYLKARLPFYMLPTAFELLESMPLTANAKLNRKALPAPAARLELADSYVAPRDALEVQLAGLWARLLGIPRVGVQDDFFELGGHSLLGATLFAEAERLTGKRLPLTALFQAPTIEQLAELLRQEGWIPSWTSLVPLQPGGSRPPLFMVHAWGGGVGHYRHLARLLGPDQPFYGLLAVGLDGRQKPKTSIEDMAAYYVREIRSLQPHGPYHLGGHSLGGAVAYEIAQQLVTQGEAVGLLALLDTGFPNYQPRTIGDRVAFHLDAIQERSWREKLAYIHRRTLLKAWKSFTRAWPALEARSPQMLRSVKDINELAFHQYRPKPYPGKVAFFRATKQSRVSRLRDPRLQWQAVAEGGLETYEINCAHVDMVREPYVHTLAERLAACLAPSQQDEA